jgi:hypothetical protein
VRTRDFIVVFVCLAAALGLLFAADTQLDSIGAQRAKMNLTSSVLPENAPPSLVFATVALGAFRGLIVDILWMRADKLKEDGQFFDARQLAEWITTLQPRFAAVWEFNAWNMAYNISVAIPASQPEQRWRWVKNGYELLRDKGIPLNPRAISLYREMGRIFQHKMGGVSDDAHQYYKLQLAEAIGPLLESPDNGLGRNDNAYFEALIRAPATWAQIAADPNVASFLQALRAADETFAAQRDFVRNYLALRQEPERFKPAAAQVIEAYRGTPALKKFDLFAKAYQLRDEWKLDPVLMQKVSQTYGPIDFADPNVHYPLDWRHPDSHAIYWAVKALDIANQYRRGTELDKEETNTDRMVLHSLQNLFRYGKIMIIQGPADPNAENGQTPVAFGPRPQAPPVRKDLFLGPDFRIFDSYFKTSLKVLEKYKGDRGDEESLSNGIRNMLKNAVLLFYQWGIKGYALRIYNELGKRYPDIPEFKLPFEQYIKARVKDELDGFGIQDAVEMIAATLTNSYYYFALHDDDTAAARADFAQQAFDYYKLKYPDSERIGLPEMSEFRWFALQDFLNNDAYPLYVRQGLLARIENERPDLYKQLLQTGIEVQKQLEAQRQTSPQAQ